MTRRSSGCAACADQASTGIMIGGKPAACTQLAKYCTDSTYSAQITAACPVTCNVCPTLMATDQANFSLLTPTLMPTGCHSCQNGDISVTRNCIQPGMTVAEALTTLALCQDSLKDLYATHVIMFMNTHQIEVASLCLFLRVSA